MIFTQQGNCAHFARFRRACAVLAAAAVITGCATTMGGVDQTTNSLELAIKEADTEIFKGQRDKAIAVLTQSAKENPTSTVPWLKIANIWFDVGNYPSSIVAANEVLQREPGNQEAKSLLVVGGLRIAAGAVSGLRTSNAVNSSARAEAESLTSSLRNALGEKSLVPTTATETKAPVPTARSKASRGKASISLVSRSTPSSTQTTSNAASADPFKSLK